MKSQIKIKSSLKKDPANPEWGSGAPPLGMDLTHTEVRISTPKRGDRGRGLIVKKIELNYKLFLEWVKESSKGNTVSITLKKLKNWINNDFTIDKELLRSYWTRNTHSKTIIIYKLKINEVIEILRKNSH